MGKLFEIQEQKFFQKPVIFSKSTEHFSIELAYGNSYHMETRIKAHFQNRVFCGFFSSELQRKEIVDKSHYV